MIDVILDTNVLVSALLSPEGDHTKTLLKILSGPQYFQIAYSSQMMDEYEDVLSRSLITLRGLKEDAEALLELIREVGQGVVPKSIGVLVYPDEKDKPFLEAAVYTDGVLISNNTKDYPFLGVRIMKAGDFLRFISQFGM